MVDHEVGFLTVTNLYMQKLVENNHFKEALFLKPKANFNFSFFCFWLIVAQLLPEIPALATDLGENPSAQILAIMETELVERWPGEEPDRRIIEAAAIQLQALEVRIRRQQRPQQIQGWRDLLYPSPQTRINQSQA